MFHNNGDLQGTGTWCFVIRLHQHSPWNEGEDKLLE